MSDTPTPAPSEPPPDRAQFWRATLAEFAASGQTVRAFCLARGLHEKQSQSRRRRVDLRDTTTVVKTPGDGL